MLPAVLLGLLLSASVQATPAYSRKPCSSSLANTTPVAAVSSVPTIATGVPSRTRKSCSSSLAATTPVGAESSAPAASVPAASPTSSRKPCKSSLPASNGGYVPSASAPDTAITSAPSVTLPVSSAPLVLTSYPKVSTFPLASLSNDLPILSATPVTEPSAPVETSSGSYPTGPIPDSPSAPAASSSKTRKPCSSSATPSAPNVTTPVGAESSAPVASPTKSRKPCSSKLPAATSPASGGETPVTTPVAGASTNSGFSTVVKSRTPCSKSTKPTGYVTK